MLLARTNPLETYIRANWTNGDPSYVGGSHYENIKIYGHSYTNLAGHQADADYIAEHFDTYMWGGQIVGDESASLNPSMLWLSEAANIPHMRSGWDLQMADSFLVNANPNNYRLDDMLLHYEVNTTTWAGSTPGWNPADDNDGDGCIEPGEGLNHDGEPSDPNRSAQCVADARVQAGGANNGFEANPASQAYIDFRAWMADGQWDAGAEGFHFDEAAYENMSLQLGRTIEYWGQSETDPSFDYIADKYEFVPSVMSEAESHTGAATVAFANVVKGAYLCHANDGSYYAPQHDLVYANLENVLLETWMTDVSSAYVENRYQMLDCPLTDFLEQGKGVVFTYREDNSMGRLFSLCMFYMINHQMAFYYYTKQGHSGLNASTGQWNPWVEYNVGQPMVNDLGLQDFQANLNTDKFFVFTSGANYQVLGREYFRDSDEAIILVLAKLMAYGQAAGQGNTTVQLNGSYRVVLQSFTLSSIVSSVTLKNNEAVILVRAGTGQPHGGCHCEPGN